MSNFRSKYYPAVFRLLNINQLRTLLGLESTDWIPMVKNINPDSVDTRMVYFTLHYGKGDIKAEYPNPQYLKLALKNFREGRW